MKNLQRQKAKKPVCIGDVGKSADFPCYMWKCPDCGYSWCGSKGFHKTCPECGQKLDWNDSIEERK